MFNKLIQAALDIEYQINKICCLLFINILYVKNNNLTNKTACMSDALLFDRNEAQLLQIACIGGIVLIQAVASDH